MHLVHVAPYYAPHVGGVESHVEAVCEEFARRGWRATVLTTRLSGTSEREVRRGVEIVRVAPSATLLRTPVTPRLARALLDLRPDVVHSHSPPPVTSYIASRAARRAGIPLVHTHHCDLELFGFGGGVVVETYRRTLGRWTLRAADAVVATTQSYARTSRDLWNADARLVPNGVDVERFHPGVSGARVRARHGLGERPVALFVGRLTHHKGVDHFIRAAESASPDVAHVVLGDGPQREALEALAHDVAPGRVLFGGGVAHDELPEWYAAADMAVLPSNSRLEAFGIVALEAMAAGRPVVATDIPGVSEVVEDDVTGLIVEPYSPPDLARAIRRLAEEPKLRERLGYAGRARVLEHFTTARVADALARLYAEVAGGRGTGESG